MKCARAIRPSDVHIQETNMKVDPTKNMMMSIELTSSFRWKPYLEAKNVWQRVMELHGFVLGGLLCKLNSMVNAKLMIYSSLGRWIV